MTPTTFPTPNPDDDWQPDPVVEARRDEILRRCREENRKMTGEEMDGILADLWKSDEELDRFLAAIRAAKYADLKTPDPYLE